jgi:hypothetical protein
MVFKYCLSLLVLSLTLAACAGAVPTTPVVVNETPTVPPTDAGQTIPTTEPTAYPQPVVEISPTASTYPGPVVEVSPTDSPYPGPGTQVMGIMVIPRSGYEPQPGDENLKRDQVFLELASSQIISTETQPPQVSAIVQGNLPDPCHSVRVVVTPPDANNLINLDVYSLVEPGKACITVLKPFTANIPLGSYTGGQFTVMVNGEKLGEFGTGYGPQPGDANLKRGEVFLDMAASKLLTTATQPHQAGALLEGNLPTPCHQLRVVVSQPDANKTINLEVYSVVDPAVICTDVLQPFEATISLGEYPGGHYSVYVNGQLLGEFDS